MSRRGIGLLGVVMAALVMAIFLPPLAALFSGSYRTVTRSEAAMMAALAASDLLERAATMRFVQAHAGDTLKVPGTPGLALMEPFAGRYQARAVVGVSQASGHTNPASGAPETGLFEVWVTLTWQEGNAGQSLDLRTLVADLGPTKAY